MLHKHQALDFISEYERILIRSLIGKSFGELTENHEKLNKEVKKTMGGEILDLEVIRIYKQGCEQGEKQTQIATIKRMLSHGLDKAEICRLLDVSEKMVDKVASGEENI